LAHLRLTDGVRKLAARAAQQKMFIEEMPAPIAVFDNKMHFLATSRVFLSNMASLFSTDVFAPSEVIGHSLYETHPKMPPRWRLIHARALAGEELAQDEDALPGQNVHTDWVRWSMKPWRTANGSIGGALLFSESTTEKVEAKNALAESEARFRATFENAAVGIAHVDSELRWIRANRALCRILGWPINELVTKSLQDITYPDDLAQDLSRIRQMMEGVTDTYSMDKRYIRKDGGIVWGRLSVSDVRSDDGKIDYFVNVIEDITERKAHEEQILLLMREVSHRAKNMLSLVQVIAEQTATRDPENFIRTFSERVQALAANQDLLVRNDWQGTDVQELVRAELSHFANLIGSRIAVGGPKLCLNPAAAQAIGLALHELATNAAKYGALSSDAGRVDVNWGRDADNFMIRWMERDGPPVYTQKQLGFGTTVMKRMAEQSVGGRVDLYFAPSGVIWHLTCPAANVLSEFVKEESQR
jgi:PAS domain S-box-containing protein